MLQAKIMEKIFIQTLKYFGAFSLSTAVAFGIIKYLSQKIFENYLVKSIENHKSNLERITISHEIQFASLHKERALVIKELYGKLYNYKTAIIHLFNFDLKEGLEREDLSRRIDFWTKVVPDFSNYFHRNRIYFSEDLCQTIDNLNNQLDDINTKTKDFMGRFEYIEEQIDAIKSKDKTFVALKEKVNGALSDEIDKIIKQLEKEFRKILGVE
jgi:uncharacterized protein YbcI